jgi:hypothetical protein
MVGFLPRRIPSFGRTVNDCMNVAIPLGGEICYNKYKEKVNRHSGNKSNRDFDTDHIPNLLTSNKFEPYLDTLANDIYSKFEDRR